MQLQKDLEELQYLIEKYINNKQLDFKEAADGSAICQIGSLEIRPFTEIMYKDIWQYSARKLAAEVTKTLSRRPEKDITECKELFSSWKQYEQSMLAAQALYKLYLMDCAEKAPDIVSKTDYITYLEIYAKSGCFESFTYEEYLEDKKIRENLKDFHNFFEFTASELMDDDYMHHLVGENHSILAYKDDFIKANKRVINVIQNNMKLDSEMER